MGNEPSIYDDWLLVVVVLHHSLWCLLCRVSFYFSNRLGVITDYSLCLFVVCEGIWCGGVYCHASTIFYSLSCWSVVMIDIVVLFWLSYVLQFDYVWYVVYFVDDSSWDLALTILIRHVWWWLILYCIYSGRYTYSMIIIIIVSSFYFYIILSFNLLNKYIEFKYNVTTQL